jgi:drug/metabolite transporter (DMT)-like permease
MALTAATGTATLVFLQLVRRGSIARMIRLPWRLVVAGFFGVAVYSILLVEACGTAAERDFGQVNLLNYLWPIWIVVLSFFLLREKTQIPVAVAGALLGFTGIVVAGGFDSLTHLPSDIAPHALALVGGFLWALYSVLVRRWKKKTKETDEEEPNGVPVYFIMCAALAAILAANRGEWVSADWWNGRTALWVLLGGVGPTGIAYYWWEISMTRGNAKLVASTGFAIPIVSSLLIGLFFRESMSWGLLLGAVLIAVGAVLADQAGKTQTQ